MLNIYLVHVGILYQQWSSVSAVSFSSGVHPLPDVRVGQGPLTKTPYFPSLSQRVLSSDIHFDKKGRQANQPHVEARPVVEFIVVGAWHRGLSRPMVVDCPQWQDITWRFQYRKYNTVVTVLNLAYNIFTIAMTGIKSHS